ncbi:Uncharacterised protein [Chryseobacterium nakagawai]|uniref:Uncharacterized protein n=1 Tax=Chryseobacterium nakagawai TaxID=1241982 RepID=A0AAD0YIX4_CHRNA|nr:hypothetical protein [Chryseobacterium nakagawai]AZA89443.1 hypothetical protein EG343_01765 [Chryseobacterium nakagawai]VEH20804.1 Uncharacterised protein [Chryseobacterium nakagawai]
MIIVDKDFKYEYLMKSYYILPPSTQSTIYKSGITIQDYNTQCNLKKMSLNKIIVDEDIDNILKIIEKETIISQECDKLFEIEDFPQKLSK